MEVPSRGEGGSTEDCVGQEVKQSQAIDMLTGEVTGVPDGLSVMFERKNGQRMTLR